MSVTQEERDTFEAIRQKLEVDQAQALQDFALLMTKPESQQFIDDIAALRDRCVTNSSPHQMLGNIVNVITMVKGQYPLRATPEAVEA